MQTLTFTYTKADGSSSERTLFAMVTPGNKYAGIDMTMMEPNEAAGFAQEAEALRLEYIMKLTSLQEKYDVKHNYRQFLESGVSKINKI
jgi:hypothetical protein